MKFVAPKVYLLGYTTCHDEGLVQYLHETDQSEFLLDWDDAKARGISEGEALCSFYAKLCYASLTDKKNKNISKTRSIEANLKATFDSGHGSVFEHCYLNFVVTNCSRVFTHELVRHRAGTAFSQTSGRYVRGDEIAFIHDPILDSIKDDIHEVLEYIEFRYMMLVEKLELDKMKDFTAKKKMTSALRRILPNGQANEIGFSVNIRQLRHMVMLRTNRQAEFEIRNIFGQIYNIVKERFPLIFYGAQEEMVEGALEITGMTLQPYDRKAE